jgi:hypothetical protein
VSHGFDIGGIASCNPERETFERALIALSAVAQDARVELVPVFSNIRHLDNDLHFWIYEFYGAALASVAHAFSKQLSTVSIACSLDIPIMAPVGSHPLLDSNYGCADLRIQHDGITLSRLDKVRQVADWDAALHNLRVCTWNPPGLLNCGVCEKCVRTMLELMAVGKLKDTRAFPTNDVTAEMVRTVTIEEKYEESWYLELVDPLAAAGRPDLVRAIRDKVAEYRRHLAWVEERDWKGAVKRMDRRFLGSSLFRSYKTMRTYVRRT